MKLREFIKRIPISERKAFSERCGTSFAHLRNIAMYGKTCGEGLAINIERESGGKVACEDLRPGVDWAYLRGSKKSA